MLHRSLAAAVVILAAGLTLVGCAEHDSTGRVEVTLSPDAASGRNYSVNVFDAQGQRVEQQYLYPGKGITFAGVPLGKATIKADGFCPQTTTVDDTSVVSVTLAVGCSH